MHYLPPSLYSPYTSAASRFSANTQNYRTTGRIAPPVPQIVERDESKRIKSHGNLDIYPSFNAFKNAKRKLANSLDMSVMALIRGMNQPETAKAYKDYREQLIQENIEAPCQPLVRYLLSLGYFPTSSNAFGPGPQGVQFSKEYRGALFWASLEDPLNFIADTSSYDPYN